MNYHSAFFIYYSKIYLKCVFWLVYPFSLRFIAYGLLDKQNLLDSDSAGSARWLFRNRFASIILKTKNNNKNRKIFLSHLNSAFITHLEITRT